MGPRCLRVATYNIHGWVGRDGLRSPARVAAVVANLGADVLALQEVDTRSLAAVQVGALSALVRAAGLRALDGATMVEATGFFGNVLLSRWPVREVRRVDLSYPGREPRGAVLARLDVGGGRTIAVAATHMGLQRRERARQAARLLAAVDAFGEGDGEPALLLGDLNEWLPVSRTLRRLKQAFGHRVAAPRSFPAWRPVLPLDRICGRPAGIVGEIRAHATPLARAASDHLPVTASVRLERG